MARERGPIEESNSLLRETNAYMALLLVDGRDGRIVAELESEDVAQVLEAWAKDDRALPTYLSLVELESHDGAILSADSSIAIRPLL
jgi:hypothetical protein